MRWGSFPDPFTEVIRKAEKELNHLVNPRTLSLVGFGADARKLYFQFTFLELSQSNLREIRDFVKEPVSLFPIPFSLEQICGALIDHCWEPAAEAALLTLCAQKYGRSEVARYLSEQRARWGRREMRDEWDYRASRPGLLSDMSVRYPNEGLEQGSSNFIEAAFRFMGSDLQGKRIIEVGCGTGRFTVRLIQNADHVTCIEFCERMILRCRQRLSNARNVSFIEGFAQDFLPLTGHDIVVCSLVLIHNVKDAEFLQLISGICDSCKTIFLFEDISHGRKTSPYTNLRPEETLEKAFTGQGFTVVRRYYYQLFTDRIVFMKLAKSELELNDNEIE